ncbi:6-phosphogluconolactonase [Actibacterium pelagium]|uniref:6-phosphogluconolactonase n=1 Tax=Actibacterium pelagium TaxID=2029103 RepID=A0A917AEG6_9RHOB|nr:6-phosphogluconolactonase [Actibacterium pelagium]GGE45845.1 6-phosphogluconolactonase [Actibacterium pelagium]
MRLIDYPDRDALMLDLAGVLAEELEMALLHEERVTFVVPGGTTPGPVFDALSVTDLDWSRVDVMLGDERWVPETSDRSNTRLLRERLLVGKAAKATLLPLYADAPQPEDKLDDLCEGIRPALPINVLLLGMGADMHTASLFPGADRLDEALSPNAPILLPMRAPGAPEPRITLTAPVLAGALSIHLLITGEEKRRALETAKATSNLRDAPVAAVLNDATVHWAD